MAQHKVAYSRQLISWDDLIGDFGDCALVPMPYSVWVVARKLLAERGQWQSTFYVGSPVPGFTFYESPEYTDSNWLIWKDELSTFLFDSEEFMTKFDDLLTAQLGIQDAIRDLQVSFERGATSGSIGSGGTIEGDYGIVPVNSPEYIPDNYTAEQITDWRCRRSHWLYDALVELCTLIDAALDTIIGVPVLGDIIVLFANIGSALIEILPDRAYDYITRMPTFALAEVITALADTDDKNITLAALENAFTIGELVDAFDWIESSISAAQFEFLQIVIEALARIGIDATRYQSLPDYGCSGYIGTWYEDRGDVPQWPPIEYGTGYAIWESVPYSIYNPPNSDNGYEYLYLVNSAAVLSTFTFTLADVTGLSESFRFFDINNTQLASHSTPGTWTIANVKHCELRTTRYSGERARVTIEEVV